jgi:hypothetical protein
MRTKINAKTNEDGEKLKIIHASKRGITMANKNRAKSIQNHFSLKGQTNLIPHSIKRFIADYLFVCNNQIETN